MKKINLGFGAFLVALATPAAAAELSGGIAAPGSPAFYGIAGDLSGSIGGSWFSSDGDTTSATTYQAIARAALPIAGNFKFEAEFNDTGYFNFGFPGGGAPSDYSMNGFNGFAHIYYQDPNFALGLVGGAGSYNPLSSWTVGGEGKYYMGQFTLEGTLTYTNYHLSGVSIDGTNARVGGAYYFEPNTKLALAGTWSHLTSPGGDEALDGYGLSAELAHRFASTAWSGFLKGDWTHLTSEGESGDVSRVLVGLSIALDAPGSTLRSHDYAVPFTTDLGVAGQTPLFTGVPILLP